LSIGVGIFLGILILVAVAIAIVLWMRSPNSYRRPLLHEEEPPGAEALDLHATVEEAAVRGTPNPARR
jgi:hypothetical protein